jgi:hypothetical protein
VDRGARVLPASIEGPQAAPCTAPAGLLGARDDAARRGDGGDAEIDPRIAPETDLEPERGPSDRQPLRNVRERLPRRLIDE